MQPLAHTPPLTATLTPASVRAALPVLQQRFATRWCASLALAGVLGLWLLCWVLAATSGWALRLPLAVLLGVLAGLLVILGHEAGHGSLSPWPRWNAVAARLAFLPALQSASGWNHAHRRHHAFTNLKQRDDGYPPPSPQDWLQMTALQRFGHRASLSWLGLWLLYFGVWRRCVVWVRQPAKNEWLVLRFDSALLLVFVVLQVTAVLALAAPGTSPIALGLMVAAQVLLPFLVMNWLVSAITLLHHRHPQVRWFDDEKQWSVFDGQVAGTVHVQLPPWLRGALMNIFEHSAHHVDLRRPFVALPAAQQAIEAAFPGVVQTSPMAATAWANNWPAPVALWAHLRHVKRECQLYDYRQHRWLRFVDMKVGC